MNNPLLITPSGNSVQRAIINVLNAITQEMYKGRVKQAQTDITTNKTEIEQGLLQVQADIVEGVVDEYNTVIGG